MSNLLRSVWLGPPIETLWYSTMQHSCQYSESFSSGWKWLACTRVYQTKKGVWHLDKKENFQNNLKTAYTVAKFQTQIEISLTCITSWLHHKIAWCSIDNHTFLTPVLLIIKPCVGGTIPSRDSNFDLTCRQDRSICIEYKKNDKFYVFKPNAFF